MILILVAFSSNKGSGEPAQTRESSFIFATDIGTDIYKVASQFENRPTVATKACDRSAVAQW